MTASRKLILAALAVALVQIGILSWMIIGRAMILRNGHEIVLEVEPVDPRDLLRGDYVRLGYNISRLPGALFGAAGATVEAPPPASRPVVFVRLRAGADGIWQPVAATYGAPPPAALQPGEVDLRGVADYRTGPAAQTVLVSYGIERFYLPEGEGKPIEDTMRERSFRMAVAVAGDGTAQIKAFYDGDELIYSEPLY